MSKYRVIFTKGSSIIKAVSLEYLISAHGVLIHTTVQFVVDVKFAILLSQELISSCQ